MFRKYTISATSLKTYEDCPYRAKLRYKDKKPEKDLNSRNFVVGSAMHNIMDDWVRGKSRLEAVPANLREFKPFTVGWPASVAQFYLASEIAKNKNTFRYLSLKYETLNKYGPALDDHGQLLNKLVRACNVAEQIAFTLKFKENGVQTEVKIDMPYSKHQDFKFFGFIDIVLNNTILDWKASTSREWCVESQIVMYAWLYYKMTGTRVKLAGWLLPLIESGKHSEIVTITDEMLEDISNRVDNYVKAFVEDDFPIQPKKDSLCGRCPYKSICPRHSNSNDGLLSLDLEKLWG